MITTILFQGSKISLAAEHKNTLPSLIQNTLQPDEQVLWWEHPKGKYIRMPPRFTNVLFDIFITYTVVYISVLLITYFLFHIPIPSLSHSIFFLIVTWTTNYLALYTKTFTKILWARPTYHKYTVYAISNKRIIIGIHPPGLRAQTIIYEPQEIDQLVCTIRPDGAGSLSFGQPHKARSALYAIPGGFIGIRNVQQVAAMVETLKEDYVSQNHSTEDKNR